MNIGHLLSCDQKLEVSTVNRRYWSHDSKTVVKSGEVVSTFTLVNGNSRKDQSFVSGRSHRREKEYL